MKPLSQCLLYAFVDTAYLNGRPVEMVAQQLCQGGADLIQLRAKDSPIEEVRRMAQAIVPITRNAGAGLVINDHLSIAREVGADFCHLGQEDFAETGCKSVSELYQDGNRIGIGLSTHSPDQARLSLEANADYIAIGPVYPTGTKPTAKPVTLDYVRWAAANVNIPWFAIGGIHLRNLNEVVAAGARRVCVVSAILNQPDIRTVCEAFKRRLAGAD
jgi:thiamine-phosphate pyrophosphorylase